MLRRQFGYRGPAAVLTELIAFFVFDVSKDRPCEKREER